MFTNVTYDYYSDTLGRATIPDEETFNNYKLENIAYMKTLLPYLSEREQNGIDNAVCMMIEEDYNSSKNHTESGEIITSFSLDGYSQSVDISRAEDVKQKKYKWIKLFCYVDSGVI